MGREKEAAVKNNLYYEEETQRKTRWVFSFIFLSLYHYSLFIINLKGEENER